MNKNNNDYIIQLFNLTKVYSSVKKTFTALDNISLNFIRNQSVGILGHNGSGKTTMVEMITGIKNITGGSIKYNFVNKNCPNKLNIGIQFQETSFPSGFKVIDILNFYLEIFQSTWDKEELFEALKLFQLFDKLDCKIPKLSQGQQQRLNIILSIIHNPELIILDEISTGLDILAKNKIKNFIKKLVFKQNSTLFLISHNISEIEELCERIIILNAGKLYYDGTLENIQKKYGSLANLLDEYFQNISYNDDLDGANHG